MAIHLHPDRFHRRRAVMCCLLAASALPSALMVGPQAAHAQTPGQSADNADNALTTIVVTAQRRAEKAQSVPISIASISGQALENTGYKSITDIQYVVPGVQYDPTQGAAFQIRGVGSTSFDFSNAKSVNVVVDDVVMDAQRDNGLIGLSDIARVDVLMGPQGTLFGKNSTSGVISVTTNKPVLHRYSGDFYASYGERNDRTINATVNVPLGQDTALRVSGFENGQDGKGRYVVLNRNLGLVSEYGVRAKLLYRPSAALEVVLAGEYTHHIDTSIRVAVGGPAGTSFAPSAKVTAQEIALGVTPGPQNADSADGSLGHNLTVNKGGSAHVTYDLGGITLTSISAYRHTVYNNNTPADLLPLNQYAYVPYNAGSLGTDKVSEEVHLASPSGGRIEYLLGAFYNRLTANQTQMQWGTLGTPTVSATGVPAATLYTLTGASDPVSGALLGNAVDFRAHDETIAAFGQAKLNLTSGFSLTLGGRYNHDRNDQTISYINIDPVSILGYAPKFVATSSAPTADYRQGEKSGSRFTYRIAPQYNINKNVMVYGTYSTGYKPGGVAFVGNKYDPYNPESVKSFEIGEKGEFFGHRLRVNADVFSATYNNFQATILTPVSTGIGGFILASAIGNAPGLRSRGVEGSIAVKATRTLTLNGAVTYTDAEFTNYVASPTANYTGTSLTNSPKWSINASADYSDHITSSMVLDAHVDYSYRSAVQTVTGAMLGNITAPAVVHADGTSTPNASYSLVPGYGLVNLRVAVGPDNKKVQVGVFVRNLFNTYYSTGWQLYGTLGLLHYTTPDAYRTVGGFVRMSF